MRFWAGVTDNRWYQFVNHRQFDEVNFWQPSARPPFSGLPEGTPFLFKLKRPHHHIAGGGLFVRYTRLPLITAWEVFGEQNGASSLQEFHALIGGNRHRLHGQPLNSLPEDSRDHPNAEYLRWHNENRFAA